MVISPLSQPAFMSALAWRQLRDPAHLMARWGLPTLKSQASGSHRRRFSPQQWRILSAPKSASEADLNAGSSDHAVADNLDEVVEEIITSPQIR